MKAAHESRLIKEWTAKAPAWNEIVQRYSASPGRVQWLADRLKVLRGEIDDSPEPELVSAIQRKDDAA